jgi:hypothetical protein
MTRAVAFVAALAALLNNAQGVVTERRVAAHYGPEASSPRAGDAAPAAFLPARFAGFTLIEGDTVRVDEHGIPSVIMWSTGKFNQSPTTVAQWGLGGYARGDFEMARKASEWLLAHQSANGGFPLTYDHAIPGGRGYHLTAPWYSAITQGNAISLLVRMWKVDDNPAYLKAAKQALRLLQTPVAQGGVQGRLNGGVWFELTPDPRYPNHIFNGSVFALLAIHDLATIGGDAEAMALWQAGEASLRANIGEYLVQAPFHPGAPKNLPERWAVYDLQVNGEPAVPNYLGDFYMEVHCELMEEMAARTGRPEYAQVAEIWRQSLSTYLASQRNTAP